MLLWVASLKTVACGENPVFRKVLQTMQHKRAFDVSFMTGLSGSL